jgi:hypothetical protein
MFIRAWHQRSICYSVFDRLFAASVECASCNDITLPVKDIVPLHDHGDPPMGFRGHPHQG